MTLQVPQLPFPLDPLIAEAKRRARQRRLLVCLGLVLLGGVVAALTVALRPSGGGPSGGLAIPTVAIRAGSLAVSVPRGFKRLEFRRRGRVIGFLLTDYRVTPDSPTLRAAVFPANGVLLSLARAPTVLQRSVPQLRLPLTLRELGGPKSHNDGTTWNNMFDFRDQAYAITFWAGDKAPKIDRAALQNALLSIHAPGSSGVIPEHWRRRAS
jgi:hypothetical protein